MGVADAARAMDRTVRTEVNCILAGEFGFGGLERGFEECEEF